MAYRVWVEIKCKCCERTTGRRSVTGMFMPRQVMAREATAEGWKLLNGDWACPDHSNELTTG